jgi:hypothetical protein
MSSTLIVEPKGVFITLSGKVTGDEIFVLNRQVIGDERFPGWRYQIWDFSKVEAIDVSFDQLRSLVFQDAVAARHCPDHRIAIITRKPARTGLDSVYHLLSEEWGGYPSKTFHRVHAARKWAAAP